MKTSTMSEQQERADPLVNAREDYARLMVGETSDGGKAALAFLTRCSSMLCAREKSHTLQG